MCSIFLLLCSIKYIKILQNFFCLIIQCVSSSCVAYLDSSGSRGDELRGHFHAPLLLSKKKKISQFIMPQNSVSRQQCYKFHVILLYVQHKFSKVYIVHAQLQKSIITTSSSKFPRAITKYATYFFQSGVYCAISLLLYCEHHKTEQQPFVVPFFMLYFISFLLICFQFGNFSGGVQGKNYKPIFYVNFRSQCKTIKP
eukprot:TRINITY_DN1127_c1_g1_i9.p1 TRINITY_DN1127_c1_g1~~TRINITY_DN1127_c1_g1_i9.p1  ORF type:complete len:231 (-),score=13.77 TRINITY_DN1127_c1_g1_i9:747-1340(-)